jgi:hypothetical protein
MIVTSADDNQVIIWNTQTRQKVGLATVNVKAVRNKERGASTLSSLPDS